MTFENKNLRCRDCKFSWPTVEVTGNAGAGRRQLRLPIYPTTAGAIRLGRLPNATTGAASTSTF